MDVLVEVPEVVQSIQSIDASFDVNQKSSLLFVTKTSIIVVDSTSGSLLKNFSLKDYNSTILDCTYAPNTKSFIVVLDNSSIVSFDQNSEDLSKQAKQYKWTVKPLKVKIDAAHNKILIYCEGGYIAKINNSEPSIPQRMESLTPSKLSESVWFGSSPNNFVTVYQHASNEKQKKNDKSSIQLLMWEKQSHQKSWFTTADSTSHVIQDSRQLFDVVIHQSTDCVYLIFNNDSTSDIVKYSCRGEQLFTVSTSSTVKYVNSLSSGIWIIDALSNIHALNEAYGVVDNVWSSPQQWSGAVLLSNSEENKNNVVMITTNSLVTSNATRVYKQDIPFRASITMNLFDMINQAANNPTHRQVSSASTTSSSVINRMNTTIKNELTEASKLNGQTIINRDSAKVFCEELEHHATQNKPIHADDWKILNPIISSGLFSTQEYKEVFEHTLAEFKVDLLLKLLSFCPDIDEFQIVYIYQAILLAPVDALTSINVGKHTICKSSTVKTITSKKRKANELESTSSDENDKRMNVVYFALRLCLSRTSGFSKFIISEAVQKVSLELSVLLLRLLTYIIGEDGSYSSDVEVSQALVWLHGILEGNFAVFVLKAATSTAIKVAIANAMQVVRGVDDIHSQLQDLCGVCDHVQRVANRKGTQIRPPETFYSFERISL